MSTSSQTMGQTPAPAYFAISADNHAAWVVATSLIFLIYSILAVVAKVLLRINVTSMKAPDICLVVCLAFLVIQTALVIRACRLGLGQHREVLSHAAFTAYDKYHYASSLMIIAIQAGTKISICLWISAISPQYRLNLMNRILMGIIGVWAISGIFATAFQCDLPAPWRTSSNTMCVSVHGIYIYNGTMNVLTDLVICVLPIAMMWRVHTTTTRKLQVCALFGSRIAVPAITIPTLATSTAYFDHLHTDPTWYIVVPAILSQISVNMSVLTACIPGLKSILDNLLSGTANARVRGAYNLTSSTDKKTRLDVTPWNRSSTSRKQSGPTPKPTSKTKTNASNSRSHSLNNNSSYRFSISGGVGSTAAAMSGARHHGSADTSESQRNLSDGVIYCTDGYEVSSIQQLSRPHTEDIHPDAIQKVE